MKRKEEVEQQRSEENKKRKLEETDAMALSSPGQGDMSGSSVQIQSYDSQAWVDADSIGQSMVIVQDDVNIFSKLPGRRSFGDFNIPVQKEYERYVNEVRFNRAVEKAEVNTVSDEEMLRRYETLIGLPRGPNQGKAPPNPNKTKGGNSSGHGRKGNGSKHR